ncbi:MAG: triose-phosphate isomerase [Methanimicrococcus sp.]|nr:triose-phosphate isomerase [Methanimicrococcus sp.]
MSVFILLNCKTFDEGTGENAVKLAEACREVAQSAGVEIAIAPQIPDIYRTAKSVDIPVFSQHVDGAGPGSHTGAIYAKAIKEAGAAGSLINHSERRLTLADIESAAAALKKNKMSSVICVNNVSTAAAAAAFNPTYVAIEPPELIGSGISVSKANPDIITDSVDAAARINPHVKVLCGAGISQGEDLKVAVELGAKGVLLASGIVKADDPKGALYNLVSLI